MRYLRLHPRVRAAFLGLLVALLVPLGAARAGAADSEAVREYVDEVTAVSITVSLDSLVFARERSDLAANARDYITLAPLEINRTGRRALFWSGDRWSTTDSQTRRECVVRCD